jgi:hypothetical protein
MSRFSIQTRSIRSAVAGLLLIGLMSPANASNQIAPFEALPDLPASAAEHLASAEPTSRLPWLAPVGHRQPSRAHVPQSESLSAWER